jgi:outer membrane protein assembly factor BamD (BamD/ComL family)
LAISAPLYDTWLPVRRGVHTTGGRTSPGNTSSRDSRSEVAHDKELAAERALIETAQTAMARRDAAAALATLERAASRYPSGRLEEERENLRVQCLIQVGRHAEARAVGDRFRKRFPASMMLGVVNL